MALAAVPTAPLEKLPEDVPCRLLGSRTYPDSLCSGEFIEFSSRASFLDEPIPDQP